MITHTTLDGGWIRSESDTHPRMSIETISETLGTAIIERVQGWLLEREAAQREKEMLDALDAMTAIPKLTNADIVAFEKSQELTAKHGTVSKEVSGDIADNHYHK